MRGLHVPAPRAFIEFGIRFEQSVLRYIVWRVERLIESRGPESVDPNLGELRE